MTKEDKQLLLKDICARLPYGVVLNVDNGKYREDKKIWPGLFNSDNLWDAKPYLRPMSSMTKEEKIARDYYCGYKPYYEEEDCGENYLTECDMPDYMDWLLSHHFDFRGLIPMGLALEAPDGMYK